LIEGFPKNLENVETWNRKMKGICHTKLFMYFDVDNEVTQKRLKEME
tara:strand:- start:158 stop:298 length:141 start_codon:yes stop_codon:yes gene_type:complete